MDDCPICYEKVNDKTGHCTLACTHSFHISCLTKWSKDTPSCPMCRNALNDMEVAREPDRVQEFLAEWLDGRQHLFIYTPVPEPPPPPGPAPPANRILNIGEGVSVPESDVALVMQHASVTRGQAVRALRRYEGDIVNSILMLTNPDEATSHPPPPPRDPMVDPSDDQATTWFIQSMFEDTGYAWNSYSDMKYRMRNNMRAHDFWVHREFQEMESGSKLEEGYMSA